MKYFLYILECKDKSLYTGITTDIKRRLSEHNEGSKGAKYTRARRPVKIVFIEELVGKSEALKREYEVKKLKRSDKFFLIEEFKNKKNN